MRAIWRLGAVLAMLSSAGAAAPDCAGEREISGARIMRIEQNGVLVLSDGRALKLEGVRLPSAAQDRAPKEIADQAKAELDDLAKGRTLSVHAIYPKEDRYDRVRGQLFAEGGQWLQIDLLKKGLARADISPDRGECYRELYAAEAEARQAHLGLWANPAYAIRTRETVRGDIGTFQIVSGRILSATQSDGAVYLEFGRDWRRDFMVVISPDDVKTFKRMGVDPMNYGGKQVRVRGLIQARGGPVIAAGNPKQIELLQ